MDSQESKDTSAIHYTQSREQDRAGLGVESFSVAQRFPGASQFLSSIGAPSWLGTSHEETEPPVVSIKQLRSPLLSWAPEMPGEAVSILRKGGLAPSHTVI